MMTLLTRKRRRLHQSLIRLISFCLGLVFVGFIVEALTVWNYQPKTVSFILPKVKTHHSNITNVIISNKSMDWLPHDPPILDFFIRTWQGDGHWLVYLLRSIQRFVPRTIYRDIIITFSAAETAFFYSYLSYFPLPIKLKPMDDVFIRGGLNNGSYYTQMYAKYYAYTHSDADFFIHIDSDTMFKEPITRIYLHDEKNRVYINRVKFSMLSRHYQEWKRGAEQLFKEPVLYETMTGFPTVYPRDLYPKAIHFIEKIHGKPLVEVFRSLKAFNEFTPLGHYLITHMPATRWIDNSNKSKKIIQSWSWDGLKPINVAYYECILRAKHCSMCDTMLPNLSHVILY